MKQKIVFLFFLCSLFSCASVQQNSLAKQSDTLIKSALADNTGYKTIEGLTTEIGPRLAGSKEEERARVWSVKKMKALGLKNVRIENFKVRHWERISESARILSPNPQALRVTALGGSVSTPKQGVSAQVVKFASFKELEDSPMEVLKNKIAFIDEPMTRTKDGSGYSVAVVKRRRTTIEAAKRGALAALIRSVGTDHHRFPHTGQTGYEDGVKKIAIGALSAPDADQLARSLERGAVKIFLSLKTKSKGFLDSGNVIGEIPGLDDQIVLAGAHLDSWDLGTGAVDDGAGVGIVLGAAHNIIKQNLKPKHTIRIVLFGSEEVGLVGAKAYAKKHDLKTHLVAAESDFGAGEIWKIDTKFSAEARLKVKPLFRKLKKIGIKPGNNNAYGGPDLIPMREKGVPVVTLKQDGWDYFDLHHTEDDTLDKISPKKIAQNVAAYSTFLWFCSNSDFRFN